MAEKTTYTNIHDLRLAIERLKSSDSTMPIRTQMVQFQTFDTAIRNHEGQIKGIVNDNGAGVSFIPATGIRMSQATSAALIAGITREEIQATYVNVKENGAPSITGESS